MRLPATLAIGVVSVALLTGCTASGPERGPEQTAQALLDALSAGDGPAALALMTSPGSPACTDLLDRYGDLAAPITSARLGEVVTDGPNDATVEVTYTVYDGTPEPAATTLTYDLRLDGGEWIVVFPETYRLAVALPDHGMAEIAVAEDVRANQWCMGEVAGAAALPGTYTLAAIDPSGVFRTEFTTDAVVTGEEGRSTDLTATFDGQFDAIAQLIEIQLSTFAYTCSVEGYTGPTCPLSVPPAGSGIAPEVADRISGAPEVSTINNPTGTTWSFMARGGDFLYTEGGVAKALPITYLGTVSREGEDLVVTLD